MQVENQSPGGTRDENSGANGRTPHAVLLVEDNAADRRLIEIHLDEAFPGAVAVTSVSTLHAAYDALETVRFDIVFLDLGLPDCTGVEVLARLAGRIPDIPIVVITHQDSEAVGRDAIRKGAQDFLPKSNINAGSIAAAMRHTIERHKLYRQLERMIAENADAILIVSLDGAIRFANRAAAALFHMPADRLVGRMIGVDLAGQSRAEMELTLNVAAPVIADLHIAQTHWAGAAAHLVTLRDISRQRAEEQRLITEKELALAVGDAKNKFLSSLDHELRTPLDAIIGFAEFILTEVHGPLDDRRYKSYLEYIRDSGNALMTQVTDLLDLARIDSDQLSLVVDEVNLNQLVERTVAHMLPWSRVMDVAIETQLPEDDIYIQGDHNRLAQALRAILSNSIKFSPRQGTVTVQLTALGANALLQIKDTGCGLAAEDIPRIFEPFTQTFRTGQRAIRKGSGLGLPLARQLVALHAGDVIMESRPGGGTSVAIRLPDMAARSGGKDPRPSVGQRLI
ncbi:ATP-binding response regulator [Eilatimonas milleporae]|uniref:histidine kinase n=1 Tax=Eilatimonas milleporae TaxID=911205 RepID=A0A3M0CDX1_9PROT|nr:hybrid sensor histidine kinase/response regulator [Eilatimonas milleporae]RMB08021.1 signal transduction histidine kinase [Eilatimonas milleporae]